MEDPDRKNINNKNWFALYTKSKNEFQAALQINSIGVEYYLPSITRVKRWSDRKKKIKEPVLRGYIFIYADEKERLLSLEQMAVVRCVYDKGKKRPAIIPEWQMDNLKRFLEVEAEFFTSDRLIRGVQVLIKEGPFEGVAGIIQETDNGKTIGVSIELLNRTVIAHLPRDFEFEIISRPKS